jgi:4-hydroxy-tetrahydrodipicolinate reductase
LGLPFKVGIIGSSGKLGRRIGSLAAELGYAVTLSASSGQWLAEEIPDAVIDVSHHSAFPDVARYCSSHRVPLVEGVSTLTPEHLDELRRLGASAPALYAPNFTQGHYLQRLAVTALAVFLKTSGSDWECAIAERHPVSKRDRPSATARELAGVWQASAGRAVADIGAVRGGLPVSDHDMILTCREESLTIRHSVNDRGAAARGGLLAARWIVKQQPGFYRMADVFEPGRENGSGVINDGRIFAYRK